jgi:DoxX-like family
MQSGAQAAVSKKAVWAGRVLSGLAVLFLIFDASVKVLKSPFAIEATTQLGYPESVVVTLGLIEIACMIVYLIPNTSVLGTILWTGYLGGAVATHVRIASPLFTHALVPTYVAALLWLGLWLRDNRLRALLPTS